HRTILSPRCAGRDQDLIGEPDGGTDARDRGNTAQDDAGEGRARPACVHQCEWQAGGTALLPGALVSLLRALGIRVRGLYATKDTFVSIGRARDDSRRS